ELILWINDGTDHLEPRRVNAHGRLNSRSVLLEEEPTADNPAMPSGHQQQDSVLVISCRCLAPVEMSAMAPVSVAQAFTSSVGRHAGRAPPFATSQPINNSLRSSVFL